VALRLLLDTNAYVAVKRGDAGAVSRLRQAEAVLVSAVVAGELLHGFRAGRRFEEKRREFEGFLDHPLVRLLPVTLRTAEHFARIVTELRAAGRPIPTNDIWIAAQAMEEGATLLSADRHFAAVTGLGWEDWREER
jgi:predicted nucleic acid-binding protein